MEYQLCPSILSADFNRLGEQIQILEKQGVKWLHIDVMDGDFVPSISFGMPVIRSIRKESRMFFDVHLMVSAPERYIQDFVDCGADSITVHSEACEDLERAIELIRDAGVKVGVSIKPATPVNDISHLLDEIDMVLIMTVQPGFGGQKYIPECTEKIQELKEIIDKEELDVDIQVDGGINDSTLETVMDASLVLVIHFVAECRCMEVKRHGKILRLLLIENFKQNIQESTHLRHEQRHGAHHQLQLRRTQAGAGQKDHPPRSPLRRVHHAGGLLHLPVPAG